MRAPMDTLSDTERHVRCVLEFIARLSHFRGDDQSMEMLEMLSHRTPSAGNTTH
jgi:hypothetical protein